MFIDRKDAGQQLGEALERYADDDTLVLAIPCGGVEVGCGVARRLGSDLSLLVARKLPFKYNPEAGFGAIAEDGSVYLVERVRASVSQAEIEWTIRDQAEEVKRRVRLLRGGRPLPPVKGRTVILVDDGIAMGSTMRAAMMMVRKKEPARLVVAAPVAGPRVASELERLADDVVILETPPFFRAVAQVYSNWYDVPDREVVRLMQNWEENGGPA